MQETAEEAAEQKGNTGHNTPDPPATAVSMCRHQTREAFGDLDQSQCNAGEKHPRPEAQREQRLAKGVQVPRLRSRNLIHRTEPVRRVRHKKQHASGDAAEPANTTARRRRGRVPVRNTCIANGGHNSRRPGRMCRI